jgi:phospholipase/carboxylesterase
MIVHGTRDAVLPISFGRQLKEWFERLPVDLTYREYDMAHEITGKSLADIQKWIAEQLG